MSLEGLKNLRDLIALGSLFHDIGKLKRRLEENPSEEKQQQQQTQNGKDNETEKEKDNYKYLHEKLGEEFVKDFLKKLKFGEDFVNRLKELCKKYNLLEDCNNLEPLKVILAAFHHHSPKNAGDYEFFAEIYQKADIVSATERDEINTDELQTKEKRLHSIFESVEVFETLPKKEWVYRIEPLEVREETTSQELRKLIFPLLIGEQVGKPSEVRKYDKGLYREIYGEYLELFGKFKDALKKNVEEVGNISNLTEKVYHLFYKYLWSVPSATYSGKKGVYHYPDISLFDHSRGTAAIATSLVTDYNLKQLKEGKETKLILLTGDISGIQRFLFGVRNVKGVARRLRARSFFLALLPQLVANYILEKLGYNPTVNTLYASAGKFEALIGYEEGIEETLRGLQKEIEEILLKEFGGKLGLVLAYEIFPLEGLKKYGEVVKEVHRKLNKEKKKKFKLTLLEAEKLINERVEKLIKQGKDTKLCPSCGWEVIEEEREFCDWCQTFQEVGGKLPKVRYIAFGKNYIPYSWEAYFELPELGKIFLLSEDDFKIFQPVSKSGKVFLSDKNVVDLEELNRDLRIFKLNATDIEGNPNILGFKFICQAVPTLKEGAENLSKLWEETLEDREGKPEGGNIIPFTLLEELAIGDKKLGYFKADVDNLGLIFMSGFEKYTFSRIATLSRMLDLFFSLYVDRFARDLKGELKKEVYQIEVNGKPHQFVEKEYLDEVDSPIYTVFSGGDDLFLIAPWNVAVKVATRLREEFRDYTCRNPNFGISAGLGIFKGTFPIRLASDGTEALESKAKNKISKNGKKDKIAVFNTVLDWNKLKEVDEGIFKIWLPKFAERKISRSLLYRLYIKLKPLLTLKEEAEKRRKEDPTPWNEFLKELYRFIPYFYYQLARNVKEEELKRKLEEIFVNLSAGKDEEIVNLEGGIVFLSYLLMLTRNLKLEEVEKYETSGV